MIDGAFSVGLVQPASRPLVQRLSNKPIIPVDFLFNLLDTRNPNPVVDVVRDSDSAEASFTAADLVGSPSALVTWVTANGNPTASGYVSKVYNSEGATVLVQTDPAKRPQIVGNGVQRLDASGKVGMSMNVSVFQVGVPQNVTLFNIYGIGDKEGYYWNGGGLTFEGKPFWEHYDWVFAPSGAGLRYEGGRWKLVSDNGASPTVLWQADAGAELYPWEAVNWTKVNGTGDGPVVFTGFDAQPYDYYTGSQRSLTFSPVWGIGPQISQFVDNAIAGLTASGTTYNSFIDRTIGSRNPNNWLAQQGLITSPTAFRDGFGTGTWQSPHLIAPNVATVANHLGANSYAPGVEYWFADANGNVEKLVVESSSPQILTSDLRLVKFTTEASANIGYYKVLHPDDYNDLGLRWGNTPMVYSRIGKTTFIGDISGLGSGFVKKLPVDAQRLTFHQTVVTGDSGDGVYLPVPVEGGQWELVLLGHWHTATNGPFISFKAYFDEINTWLAANTAYQLDTVRFEGYGQSVVYGPDYGSPSKGDFLGYGATPTPTTEPFLSYLQVYGKKSVYHNGELARLARLYYNTSPIVPTFKDPLI